MLAERPRVLIATSKTHQGEFKSLFEREPLHKWQALYAESFSQARFTMLNNPCEALIVHEDLLEAEGGQGLSWLSWRKDYPVLFTGQSASLFQRAYELGVQQSVAFDMALSHPLLLDTVLQRARLSMETSKILDRTRDNLSQSRKHIDRLVTLMWRSSPAHLDNQWYSQPYMMERLQEELARAERHKLPLSLAVGELKDTEETDAVLPEWTPDFLVKGKRRCDVVGQYGPKSFMLLMVHTPKVGGITCCKRLQNSIEHPSDAVATLPGPRPALRAYFGLTTTHGDHYSPQTMLRCAEQNLDAARHEKAMRIVSD